MGFVALEYKKTDEHIAIITMKREKEMNTLSRELIAELRETLNDARADASVKSIVITAKGQRAFCCGAKLDYFFKGEDIDVIQLRDYLIKVQDLFIFIRELEKPVIAAINGFALGGGAEMALAADFRVMSDSAKFGVPEIDLGVLAGAGGVQVLPGLVGRAKALEMNMLGEHIEAEEAKEVGLIYSSVPADKLMDEAMSLARKLAGKSPLAMAYMKSCINNSQDVSTKEAMRQGLNAMLLCISSEINKEGIKAFFEKRKPRFEGISFGAG